LAKLPFKDDVLIQISSSTMVTAILPAMTQEYPDDDPFSRAALGGGGRNHVPSISSEVTITPTTNRATLDTPPKSDSQAASYRLAGFVGVFTGLGALVALFGFLPLPARFQAGGQTPSHAVALSFLIVSIVALLVAVVCFSGLANLPGEGEKSLKNIFHDQDPKEEVRAQTGWVFRLYPRLLIRAVSLGVHDVDVGLAYVGGLVARASSVAISLFIPLFVNAYFISSGRCSIAPGLNPHDPSEIKKECRKAYIVAAKLTGTSQMVALLCAPLFGYLSARYKISNAPLLIAAVAGVAGNAAFARLKTPDPAEGGGIAVYFIVMLIGIGQIGAIVCSLGLLARGIHTKEGTKVTASNESIENEGDDSEAAPLMQPLIAPMPTTRAHLKGSIAGVYSLAGGAGILLLTKVGGLMFDKVDTGSPFYIMSLFNAMLLLAGIGAAVVNYCSS
jgi:hypothetical protein